MGKMRTVLASAAALAVLSAPATADLGDRTPAVKARGRGNPWVSFGDGRELQAAVASPRTGLAFDEQTLRGGEPRGLASIDLDEDGMPDLVVTLAMPGGGGAVVVYPGNVDQLFPDAEGALERRALGTFVDGPFLAVRSVVRVHVTPDLVATGDFDADGHMDVVVGERGGDSLSLLPGDGQAGFRSVRHVALPGTLTALAAGDVNRRDGLQDLVLTTDSSSGPRLVVFEGPGGASLARPEILDLPESGTALALGELDGTVGLDIAVASGHELVIVHGRDRMLTLDQANRDSVPTARLTRQRFPFTIASVAIGDLVANDLMADDGSYAREIALLSTDGSVHFLSEAYSVRETIPSSFTLRSRMAPAPLFLASKVSSLPADDLLLVDSTGTRLSIVTPESAANWRDPLEQLRATARHRLATDLEVGSEIVAVLPMRLNLDAIKDLVILRSKSPSPVYVMSRPMATFTVTSILGGGAGTGDCNLANSSCETFNLQLGQCIGNCTLPAAIQNVNAQAGADQIDFDIPGGGVPEIPTGIGTISTPATLNAASQPGGRVKLFDPLGLTGGSSVVRGIVGIVQIATQGNDIVEGNFLGTNADGTGPDSAPRASVGLSIASVNNILVGGTTAPARNIISGNVADGASYTGNDHTFQGNYVGLDVTGTTAVPNGSAGITPSNVANNITVGGTAAGAGNVISGGASATNFGVRIGFGSGTSSGSLVQGNRIGTDASGTVAVANAGFGVSVESGPTTVGGTTPAARNVISGNGSGGLRLSGTNSILVQGNYVGLNASGSPLGNVGRGIHVLGTAATIGGASGGNVISGNTAGGVLVGNSPSVLSGNLIGTNPAGTAAAANGGPGVEIAFGTLGTVTIGGTTAAERNVISGNLGHGLLIGDSGLQLRGNYIGTSATGTAAVGNGLDGVHLQFVRGGSQVGGASAGEGNLIANNGGAGILLPSASSPVPLRANAIHSNGGLGIDLAPLGVTANDACDADGGPHSLQNFPELATTTSGAGTGSSTTVTGTLNSTASTTFTIDFFASDACDPSGFGEGQTYVGSTQVTTNGSCVAEINAVLPVATLGGRRVTATATSASGTSELSACAAPTVQNGNLNNDAIVDLFDVIALANFVVGNIQAGAPPFNSSAAAADLNRSGGSDVLDLVILQSFIVGNIPTIPI